MRVAIVNDDRQVQLDPQLHEATKNFLLNVPRAVVVVVIETDLTDGDDFFLRLRPCFDLREIFFRHRRGQVRMHAHRAIKRGVLFRQRQRLRAGFPVFGGNDHMLDRFQYVGDHFLAIVLKFFIVKMGMRIEQHFISPDSRPADPAGTEHATRHLANRPKSCPATIRRAI